MATESLAFSNPSIPIDTPDDIVLPSKKLSNSDFRTILNTPRPSNWNKDEVKPQTTMQPPKKVPEADKKKKIKKHKPKKIETSQEKPQKLISTPYRDRAKERREGKMPESDDPEPTLNGQYKAVSANKSENIAQAENRRQQIEESKFLGGDMKHTHLVKGLDYVLLEKARHDIEAKEREAIIKAEKANLERKKMMSDGTIQNPMCKKIFRTLFEKQVPQRNPNFHPGKMAYRIDLEDEFGEFDVPATIHRSPMECPRIDDHAGGLSSNQKVINSLTNILSYLRGERKQAKKAKQKFKTEELEPRDVGKDYDMFADLPEMHRSKNPIDEKPKKSSNIDKHRSQHDSHERRHLDKDMRGRYFDKPEDESHPIIAMGSVSATAMATASGPGMVDSLEQMKQAMRGLEKKSADKKSQEDHVVKYLKQKTQSNGYEECYPEHLESFDAMGDSDDETDYTKMDMGNKKGPVGRWDFESQEDYSKYMSNKEALPKAAFQYGVKMADGRRTRRIHTKYDKAAHEREWKQIQDLWKNRSNVAVGGGGGGGGGISSDEPDAKKAKF